MWRDPLPRMIALGEPRASLVDPSPYRVVHQHATNAIDCHASSLYRSYMNEPDVQSTVLSVEEMMIALMRSARSVEQTLEAALEPIGLSGPKYAALTHLVRAREPLSLSECAARMTCVRSNITQLVDRLEADGLVRRIHDVADRRGIRAMVTPLGIERQRAGAKLIERVGRKFAKALSAIDREALVDALASIERAAR